MMHWGGVYDMGFGGFGMGWPVTVIFWLILIAGLMYCARQLWKGENTAPVSEKAEDIVKKQYAAGKITRDEYLLKLKDMSMNLKTE